MNSFWTVNLRLIHMVRMLILVVFSPNHTYVTLANARRFYFVKGQRRHTHKCLGCIAAIVKEQKVVLCVVRR